MGTVIMTTNTIKVDATKVKPCDFLSDGDCIGLYIMLVIAIVAPISFLLGGKR